jgi:hypothetical protein
VRTTRISIAIDEVQLRRARKAAKCERVTFSAYVARALGNQLEEQERLDAARELHKGWGPESIATPEERAAFRASMARTAKAP